MACEDYRRVVKALIVGVENVGKKNLADAIVEEASKIAPIELAVVISTMIQPMEVREELSIGLIIVLVDLTMKNSWFSVQLANLFERLLERFSSADVLSELRKLSLDIFLGKLCFVLCGVKQLKEHQLSLDDVLKEMRKYDSPILYGMCKDPAEVKIVSAKIVRLLRLVCGENAIMFSGNTFSKMFYNDAEWEQL